MAFKKSRHFCKQLETGTFISRTLVTDGSALPHLCNHLQQNINNTKVIHSTEPQYMASLFSCFSADQSEMRHGLAELSQSMALVEL